MSILNEVLETIIAVFEFTIELVRCLIVLGLVCIVIGAPIALAIKLGIAFFG